MKLLADVPSRPSLAAIAAAEVTMNANAVTAVTKRNTHYTTYSTPALTLVGSLLSGITNSQQRDLWVYSKYMNGNGVNYNAKGRILSLEPNTKAPMEFSHIFTEDGVWLVCAVNPQWADFIA